MRMLIGLLLFIVSTKMVTGQDCETGSYPSPVLSDSLRQVFESNLRQAQSNYTNDSTHADYIIWYGRRLAYLGYYRDAIDVYTKGIRLFPKDARFLRHRGHRYITLRCFDKAIADLSKAVELTVNKTDEIEEDGIPNAINVPLSTLQSNIWYHLGLAYYLTGQYEKALQAYRQCSKIAENSDMYVASANWEYITKRKLNLAAEADQVLASVRPDMEIIENKDYLDILIMYKTNDPNSLIERTRSQETLRNSTLGFALGNYYLLNGQKEKAKELFKKVVAGNQWASFGFIAAEAALSRLK